ncbi:MAG TPA: manganese efflux pump, partial [Smithella sp.]|nr:manganese efflux pump [Smithella sp.]
VGGKMISKGFDDKAEVEKTDPTRGWPLLLLAVATSIDSLAVGFSFSILKNEILLPAVIIGVVCFLMTGIGMLFGKVLAGIFGRKVEIFGGFVLVAIGIKILVDHWK